MPHAGDVTLEARSRLVLAAARLLYVNGQTTDQTLAVAGQLGTYLGLSVEILPRWGELQLQIEAKGGRSLSVVAANPAGVEMARVVSAMRAIEQLHAGRLTPAEAAHEIEAIAATPPAPAWLFALAAGAGAVALAVLFGVQHLLAAALIFLSAAVAGLLRRWLARHGANLFLQPFCAALLAGVVGALAVRFGLSSSLRLVAVCPCMVLVPGPHVLSGAMDLIAGRMQLGAARMLYAGLIVTAISIGLLLGFTLLGVSLPVHEAARAVPLWQDLLAAGVAVASYSVFFSMPTRMLPWPVAVGMLAHALRWTVLAELGAGAATGALVACVFVGSILTPVARRSHMPFAAIGFASVVSMIPGVFLFRMAGGLVQLADASHTTLELLGATIADGMTAVIVIVAMSLGLVVPKLAIDWLAERTRTVKT